MLPKQALLLTWSLRRFLKVGSLLQRGYADFHVFDFNGLLGVIEHAVVGGRN
jgi:hypothetical protein